MPSPTINPVVTMTFPQAIQAITDGKKITKLEWNDQRYYGVLHEGRLMLHKPDTNQLHPWIINDGDLLGTDWVILDD